MKKSIICTITLITSSLLGVLGCSDLQAPKPKQYDEASVLTRVVLNTEAVIMKVGDSIQLAASLYSINGAHLLDIGSAKIEWISSSPLDATVDTAGLIKARRTVTAPVRIIAKLQYNGVTKADTVPLYVTANSYTASEVKIVAIDSNKMGPITFVPPRVRVDVYNGSELVIKGARIQIESSIPGIAVNYAGAGGVLGDAIFSVLNTPAYLGKFYLRVKGNLYGNEVADSIEFTGLYPDQQGLSITYDEQTQSYNVSNNSSERGLVYKMQPCGYLGIAVRFNPEPIDILFSDSSSMPVPCEPNVGVYLAHFYPDPSAIIPQLGGNIYNVPPQLGGSQFLVQRRSGNLGIITARVRLSGSKQFVGDSVSYDLREVN